MGTTNLTVVYGLAPQTSITSCAVNRPAGTWVDLAFAIDSNGVVEAFVDGVPSACTVNCALGNPPSLCYPGNPSVGFPLGSRIESPVLQLNADVASFRVDQPRLGNAAIMDLALEQPIVNGDCPPASPAPSITTTSAIPPATAWASSSIAQSPASLATNFSGMAPSYFFSTATESAPFVAYDLGSNFFITGIQGLARDDGCTSCLQWFNYVIRAGASSNAVMYWPSRAIKRALAVMASLTSV